MTLRKITVLVSLLALAMLVGCATVAGPELDGKIQEEVSNKIARDVSLDGQDIAVSVEDGRVLLTGSVDDKAQKTKAIALAGSVAGVTSVLDRLEVRS